MGRTMRRPMRTTKSEERGFPAAPRGRRPPEETQPDRFADRYKALPAVAAAEPDLDDDDDEAAETDVSNGPDDALGVYLRQMGAIPLLNRKQELALAQKLERQRTRFRRAALANWLMLHRV